MQKHNSIWQFFASVKLALMTISLLAVTSIIGTVIQQNRPFEFYAKEYGPEIARIFMVLDIPDMYRSWWFLSLLALLASNLIICSIDRFPAAWKQIRADGLGWSEDRLRKMPNLATWTTTSRAEHLIPEIASALNGAGWKTNDRQSGDRITLFSQKGAWTRVGVYVVHASILVIFLGGIIGSIFGFKGSMLIPEMMEQDQVALFHKTGFRDLGFAIRCNRFSVDFYTNGAPKEFISSLTVMENGTPMLTKDIEVNAPLRYKGITFYQSSYQPFNDFLLSIDDGSGHPETFIVPFQQQRNWDDRNLQFGIINVKARRQEVVSTKLWISDGIHPAVTTWLDTDVSAPVTVGERTFTIAARQRYATGLQVARDPGVWVVYAGCLLMLAGLAVAFFMSHRRIWLQITMSATDGTTSVLMAGSANKNRPGFKRTFEQLETLLKNGQA